MPAEGGPAGRPNDNEGLFVPVHQQVPSTSENGTTPGASPTTQNPPSALHDERRDEDSSGEPNQSLRNHGINMPPPEGDGKRESTRVSIEHSASKSVRSNDIG